MTTVERPAQENVTIRLRRAEPADAADVAAFAARTFAEAFGADNHPADMAAHLAGAYGVAQQTRELTDPEYITVLVQNDSGLLAYAQLRQHEPPPNVMERASVELRRFYVDSGWHGRGIAQRLMMHVFETARELGGDAIWLSVWERNPRAIAFYVKCGFRDVGVTDFYVGSDRQTDRVMLAELQRR
ncbi:MAG: GNAT family N-acetyltransferase [Anaerolineae bacterium]|nr:GNAT family N-acetyltransferase [Gemmatimonadaceae bacterium]